MDLEGVKLPNRIVVGKYCNWEYQGVENNRGGCTWKANSQINVGTTSHKAYFTIDDEPLLFGSLQKLLRLGLQVQKPLIL